MGFPTIRIAKNRGSKKLVVCSMLMLLGMPQAQAETLDCTAITSLPAVIGSQGIYCLTDNLGTSMTGGPDQGVNAAIIIDANNVTLDLNGFKLGGLAAGPATWMTGIWAHGRKKIVIRNGTIRGFAQGVSVSAADMNNTDSTGHLVEDLVIDGCTLKGIVVAGTGITVRRNQVLNTGGATINTTTATGISANGHGNQVIDNLVVNVAGPGGSNGTGIWAGHGAGTVVKGNAVTNITGTLIDYGIYIPSLSTVTVQDNVISGADFGIYYVGDGKYMGNLTNDISDTAFTGGTAVGIND